MQDARAAAICSAEASTGSNFIASASLPRHPPHTLNLLLQNPDRAVGGAGGWNEHHGAMSRNETTGESGEAGRLRDGDMTHETTQ